MTSRPVRSFTTSGMATAVFRFAVSPAGTVTDLHTAEASAEKTKIANTAQMMAKLAGIRLDAPDVDSLSLSKRDKNCPNRILCPVIGSPVVKLDKMGGDRSPPI